MAQSSAALGARVRSGPNRLKRAGTLSSWTRLDQYVFSEIHRPFLNSMLVYNGIFCIRILTDMTRLAGGQVDIPPHLFLWFFLSEVPAIMIMTVPLSFLLAALAAISRMSSDSEIIAPQSMGISFWRIAKPVILYGFLLTVCLSFLNHWVSPRLHQSWRAQSQAFAANLSLPTIHAGVVTPLGKRSMLFVDRVDEGKLADVFYLDQSADTEQILLAERASLYSNRTLELFGAIKIDIANRPDQGPKTLRAAELKQAFPIAEGLSIGLGSSSWRDYIDTLNLIKYFNMPGVDRRELTADILERTTDPLVAFVLAFFALPLAAGHARLRKRAGFVTGLFLFGIYFLLAKICKDAVYEDKIPMLWGFLTLPAIYMLTGIILLLAKNRWWSSPFGKLQGWVSHVVRRQIRRVRAYLHGRRSARPFETIPPSRRQSRPTRTFVFPSKLDGYVTRSFLLIYLMVQSSFMVLFLLVEYSQIAKFASRNQAEASLVLSYLLYKLPELLDASLFFCMLIAVLIVLALMSKNQEITAVRAAGGSLQRLCLPLIACGALASVASLYMENSFLPYTNRTAHSLRNSIKDNADRHFSRDQWLRNGEGQLVNFQYFDTKENRLVGVRRYRFDQEVLLERVEFPTLRFDNGWVSEGDGKSWTFYTKPETGDAVFARPGIVPAGSAFHLSLDFEDLSRSRRRASEFNILGLKEYVDYIKSLGVAISDFQTEFYAKMAQPLFPFVMVLLAIPLGFQFGRRSGFYGIGMGLLAGLVFWGLFAIVKQMGSSGIVHPLVGGWSVVVMCGFYALYRFINIE